MSLARIAIRTAAVEALKGRTMVGDAVLDSPNGALSVHESGQLEIGQDRPFISIYTDGGKVASPDGRGFIDNGNLTLIIEFGVSSAMTERDTETGYRKIIGAETPPSDSGMEYYLDILQRQIFDALADDANEWGEIYRSLHTKITDIETAARRNESGTAIAGHQIKLALEMVDDPERGDPLQPGTAWGDFLAACEDSDGELPSNAATIRSMIAGDAPEWLRLQRRRGMTAAELLALGRGPIPQDEPSETPDLKEGVGDVRSVDEA